MAKKKHSNRLTAQHKMTHGVEGIFGDEAKFHDMTVGEVAAAVLL